MGDFITDYLAYNSGNECPSVYHQWSAFSLLATAVGRSVFIRLGGNEAYEELTIYPELYVCLVGLQGSRKTFAKDVAMNVAIKHLNVPLAASVETARSITQFMSSTDGLRVYTNAKGEPVEYRPLYLAIDELKNFLSVDPIKLVDFFVGVYGRPRYVYKTAHKGMDVIDNPCVNVLACATTEYIVDQLRDRILSGGLARRMLFVNVSVDVERKGDPKVPQGGKERLERATTHLKKLSSLAGEFEWDSKADFEQYLEWYSTLQLPEDPLMHGFYNSKHIQAYKLSMLLALSSYEPKLKITFDNYEKALGLIEAIEPGMEKLFLGSGRNELAAPMQRMMDVIQASRLIVEGKEIRGIIPRKKLLQLTEKDLAPAEQYAVINHLKGTEQIFVVSQNLNGVIKEYILTKEAKESIKP